MKRYATGIYADIKKSYDLFVLDDFGNLVLLDWVGGTEHDWFISDYYV